jgi:hypothetical protein
MDHAARDEILLTSLHRNPLPIDEQRVATLDNEHVLVVSVDVWLRYRGFTAGPKRHLGSVLAIEDIPLDAWSCLIGSSDPVCGMLQEFREIVHNCQLLSHLICRKNPAKRTKGTAVSPSLSV